MSLHLPALPEPLVPPVRALVEAAWLFRGLLAEAGATPRVRRLLSQRLKAVLLAEKVLDRWAEHLGAGGPQQTA
jgi:hypothetical protein